MSEDDLRFLLTGGISLTSDYPAVPAKVEKWLVNKDW